MNMDLYLWKAPVIDDPDKAGALLDRFYEQGERSVFQPSEDIVRALENIRQRYPDDPESDDVPWSSWPIEGSDRLIALNIRWSVDNEMLDTIIAIAAEHDLVVYDPQGPDVYLARDAPDQQPAEKPTAKDFLNVMLLFLPIAGRPWRRGGSSHGAGSAGRWSRSACSSASRPSSSSMRRSLPHSRRRKTSRAPADPCLERLRPL
jgi:hypothetical protein